MIQIMFFWSVLNLVVSAANVINLVRLRRWEKELKASAEIDLLD
jgi:hypothetical protein